MGSMREIQIEVSDTDDQSTRGVEGCSQVVLYITRYDDTWLAMDEHIMILLDDVLQLTNIYRTDESIPSKDSAKA